MSTRLALILCATLLAGCDLLGIETASQTEAKREAEGRAIGSACRHAVRSIEDCYAQNPRALKAAVFSGWREMDEYMRENNVVGMPHADKILPMITETEPPAAPAPATAGPGTAPPSRPSATPPPNVVPPRPAVPPRNS